MALAGTVEAVDLPFAEAIGYFAGKANVATQRWTDVWEAAHARAFMVAGAASESLLSDLRNAVRKGIEHGTTLQEFRKDFERLVAKSGWTGWTGEKTEAGRAWRARVIYETNLNMAFAAGRYAQMSDPDVLRIYPFWVYRHSGNPHPRLQHKAWDGLTLRADDTWWSTNYPPNGFGCGCTVEPVSARGLARQGKRGPDEAPPLDISPKLVGRSSTRTQLTPAGVDPGFSYNPGAAWKGEVKIPADARMQAAPTYKPPPPAPPAPTYKTPPPAPAIAASEPMVPPQTADALAEADRELRVRYDDCGRSLTGRQRDVLESYKGSGHIGMNRHLTGRENSPELTPIIRALDAALAGAPATERAMTVFRGVQKTDPIGRARVGAVHQQRSFMSTSIRPQTAEHFGGDGVMIEIRIPEAYDGVAWVHPYPNVNHHEWEMLFRPGSRFRVVERNGNRIVLEAINEPTRRPRLTPQRTRPVV